MNRRFNQSFLAYLFFFLVLFHPGKSSATIFTNVIGDNFFSPKTNIISVGDSIRWVNQGGNTHTSTRVTNPYTWNSGDLLPGQSYITNFSQAGTFGYLCMTHAGQSGTVIVQGVNAAPSVTITNPANNSVFANGATIQIGASASDSDGSVTNVAFFVGSTLLTNDTTNPYTATTNLTAGSYTLSTVASDNSGAKATNSVSITVNAPPTISFPGGATYNVNEGSTLNFTVNFGDSDGPLSNYSVSNVPSGAIFSLFGNTGTFNWTPTYGQSYNSPYTVTFTANDSVNSAVTTNVTIHVNFVSTPIQISNQVLSNNQCQFHVSGLRLTRTNFVQASTNLSDWFSLQTNISTSASFDFTNSGVVGAKFFRVLENR